jgi:outer membrane protein assembly factor BamB
MNPDGSYKFKGSSSAVPLKSDMSPLAVGVDGTVYICGRDPNGACKGDDGLNYGTVGESYLPTFWCSKDHWLYAIDTNGNGSFKWRYNVISPTNSASAISSDGTIYIGCLDGKLYAISPEGILKWGYSTGAEIESPLTIGRDGTIYVGSNKLYAINPDGTLKWSFSTGTQTPADYISSISSLAIGDHIVYVGSNDGKLYAIGNK